MFDYAEQITPSPDIVPLALDVLTRCFACLRSKLDLALLDPGELGNREKADCFELHSPWRSYSDCTGGRMHAQMDVLDVLVRDLDNDVAELKLGHQYSGCCRMTEKMRSTRS